MFERMIEPWKMALAPYILQGCNWKSIHIIAWHANKTSELCFMFKSTKSNNFNLIYSPTLSKGKSNMHGSNKCDHHLSPSQILPRSITNNLMPNCKLDEWWYIWGFFAKKSKNASCSHSTNSWIHIGGEWILHRSKKMYSYKRKHSRAERGSVCSLSRWYITIMPSRYHQKLLGLTSRSLETTIQGSYLAGMDRGVVVASNSKTCRIDKSPIGMTFIAASWALVGFGFH